METDRQGERFRVLEPALPPEGPAAPNRMRLMIMGLLLAFAAAAAAVLAREQFDTSFHSVDELREFTAVPVLVAIPPIGPAPAGSACGWRSRPPRRSPPSRSSPRSPPTSPAATSSWFDCIGRAG